MSYGFILRFHPTVSSYDLILQLHPTVTSDGSVRPTTKITDSFSFTPVSNLFLPLFFQARLLLYCSRFPNTVDLATTEQNHPSVTVVSESIHHSTNAEKKCGERNRAGAPMLLSPEIRIRHKTAWGSGFVGGPKKHHWIREGTGKFRPPTGVRASFIYWKPYRQGTY